MIFTLTAVFITVLIIAYYLFLLWKKCQSCPPGPYGLPIIGYYPFLGEDPVETIHELSKKYNNIMSITLFGEQYWILNSYEAIEEALVAKGDNFAARPSTEYNAFFIYGNAIGNIEGIEWRTQSKFIHRYLSKLGMGKTEFEVSMNTLFDDVESYIDEQNGEAHDYWKIVNQFAFNIVSSLVCGKQFKYDEPSFLQIRQWITTMHSTIEYMNFHLSGNLFKYYSRYVTKNEQILKTNFAAFHSYVKNLLKERTITSADDNCRDLFHYLLKEYENGNDVHFEYETITSIITELLLDGTEVTSALIYSTIYLMAANPEVQRKVHEEIMDTFGNDGSFCYLDRHRVPYTQAVIAEIHRFMILVPFASFHVNKIETTLQGYKVPKRQKVLPNMYALSRNENYFAHPNQFDPNHFLDENGNYKPNKMLLPFGVGFRRCVGFKLAEVETFISFVRLMRKYEFTFPSDDHQCKHGISLRFLQPYKVCATLRY